MQRGDLIEKLHDQATWRLFVLGLLTLGVYYPYYLSRQTNRLRAYLKPETVVSDNFLIMMTALVWCSAGFTLVWFLDRHPFYQYASNLTQFAFIVMMIRWGFHTNRLINWHYKFPAHSDYCFKPSWTVLLSPLYFNYKVNQLNRLLANSALSSSR